MIRGAVLLCCFAAGLWAQYPPGTDWRRIRTPHFDIIFPGEIEPDAQRAANALETLYKPLSETLGASLPKHSTIVLADQDVTRFSGGSIGLFPRMATFQTMPAQGFWGTNDWIDTITVQEARRLVQIAKMNHGFGKVASFFFGEAGLASTLGLSLPQWWMAGDARNAESTLLRGGVGQYASSEMATRALLLSGDKFSYMKAIHGSFRDQVPSQAELGAFMVNHVERTDGPDAWNKIMARAAKRSFSPLSLSRSLKTETGHSEAATYNDTMSAIGETWKAQAAGKPFTRPQVITVQPKNVFTGYYQPTFAPGGGLLAQKQGMDTWATEVVRVRPDGSEQKLFHYAPAAGTTARTSVVNGKMVWDEYVPDPRWIRGYSEILIRDLASGRTRRLTHKTRFMNPALSPDGARIAVVEFLPDRKCSLVVLDADTGKETRRLASPDNDMIYNPAWSEDGKRVAMVTQGRAGRALQIADLEAGSFQAVIPHRDEELANPAFYRGYVLYKSSRDGVVNIFAVEIATGNCYQVTRSEFGADYPSVSPDGAKLIYSDYTARGYNVAELPLDPAAWTPVAGPAPSNVIPIANLRDYSAQVGAEPYSAARYLPSLHLFDVHSWGPAGSGSSTGFGFLSNDKMHLAEFNAAALYSTDEQTFGYLAGFSYSRFFPVLDFSIADRGRRLQYPTYEDDFTEHTASVGFHIPLNLSRGYYRTNLSIGAQVEHVGLDGGGLVPLTYSMRLSHIRQASPRDLAPPWSQMLRVSYSNTIESNNYTSNHLGLDGRYALPGLAAHQALVLETGYERNDGNYYFQRTVQFPRGYTFYTSPNLTKFGSTYEAPLFYPDWSLGQFLYIKRVSANGFYDYGQASSVLYRSTGAELVFDVALLHFPVVRVGLREAYRIDYHNPRMNVFVEFGW
jgi:Tol biopolymer transport system component